MFDRPCFPDPTIAGWDSWKRLFKARSVCRARWFCALCVEASVWSRCEVGQARIPANTRGYPRNAADVLVDRGPRSCALRSDKTDEARGLALSVEAVRRYSRPFSARPLTHEEAMQNPHPNSLVDRANTAIPTHAVAALAKAIALIEWKASVSVKTTPSMRGRA